MQYFETKIGSLQGENYKNQTRMFKNWLAI